MGGWGELEGSAQSQNLGKHPACLPHPRHGSRTSRASPVRGLRAGAQHQIMEGDRSCGVTQLSSSPGRRRHAERLRVRGLSLSFFMFNERKNHPKLVEALGYEGDGCEGALQS